MSIVIDEQDVEARVRAGARVLDTVHPGWELEVDPSAIKVVSQTACPLGQVYGTWEDGLDRLRQQNVEVDDKGVGLGFQSRLVHENPNPLITEFVEHQAATWTEYGMLDAHWRNEVETRRKPLRRKKVLNLW